MSWRKEDRRAERGYHHGNLKEALLQAALNLIAQKGAAGFTFADAAESCSRVLVRLGTGLLSGGASSDQGVGAPFWFAQNRRRR